MDKSPLRRGPLLNLINSMTTRLFLIAILACIAIYPAGSYLYRLHRRAAALEVANAAMLAELYRAEWKLYRAERVAAAQYEFFDRFQRGYWTHLPALEACRASFCQYVEYHATYVPDTSITFVYGYNDDTDHESVTIKRTSK